MPEPTKPAAPELPPSVSFEDTVKRAVEGMTKGKEELDRLPKQFKPGEGIEEVVDD